MKETELRKKAILKLAEFGFVVWFPPVVKYFQRDIFGVFDLIAIKGDLLNFIQITTLPNLSARRKKIQEFFSKNSCFIQRSYIWAWDENINDFKIEIISNWDAILKTNYV
jgi:hypothetical protein